MSFASLKKASATGNTLAKLTQEIEKLNQPQQSSSNVDDRLWKPELDKSGNGYAVIRFLPAPDGEEIPFAKVWSHAFKGPGGQWYIENSLTTLGKQDPVSEYNTELWNAGGEGSPQRAQARAQKRKLSYYSTSTLSVIPHILRTRVEFSFISMGRRSLTNLSKQCNLHSQMSNLLILSTSGKERTSS